MAKSIWIFIKGNKVCSIRDCGQTATKRINLAVVGIKQFVAFGKETDWKENVTEVEIVICDGCYEELFAGESDLGVTPEFFVFIRDWVFSSVKKMSKTWKTQLQKALREGIESSQNG